jgi:uncharacterized protein (TIGR03083 family)
MKPVEPILTVELFPPLSHELLAVLKSLRQQEWARPTVCGPWSVKDVAAHLLGGNFGRLWKRDGSSGAGPLFEMEYADLVQRINLENDIWVQAAGRISPDMLAELLELTDRRLYEYFRSLDPLQPARVSVAWAGDSRSPNWFDIAREYTEKWLHQQHIRMAVGQPLLNSRQFLYPVLDAFLRALPHTYRAVAAAQGTALSIEITGEAGGTWTLLQEERAWRLFSGQAEPARTACTVRIDQDLAWRLFTRGISPAEARPQVQIEGDEALGSQALHMVSIMA